MPIPEEIVCRIPDSVLTWIAAAEALAATGPDPAPLLVVEFFSGNWDSGQIAKASSDCGLPSYGYDILRDPVFNNMLSIPGCSLALALSLRTELHAHFALPCKTFIWMCRATFKRTSVHPWGDMSIPEVVIANGLAFIVFSLLIPILIHRAKTVSTEHPASSVLLSLPNLARKFMMWKFKRFFTWMGAFGGDTPKGLVLHTNANMHFLAK